MSFLRKPSEEPRIDLTPMVDVVFLLLIFFMISTTFVESPGISIKLPEASSQSVEREPQELKIYLSTEGDIYYLDRKISIAEGGCLHSSFLHALQHPGTVVPYLLRHEQW